MEPGLSPLSGDLFIVHRLSRRKTVPKLLCVMLMLFDTSFVG